MIKRIICLAVVLLSLPVFIGVNQAFAAFDKNYLIDDKLFTDTDSMSAAEIQSFLESKGSLLANWKDDVTMRRPGDNCVVHHATGMTAAQIIYEASKGWRAQVYNSNGCAIQGAYWDQPAYSNYKLPTVSPKVILSTLQKEQSLITADGTYSKNSDAYKNPTCCSSNQYKLAYAMGYGVPDSGSINKKYLGFYNQVNWAAWQFRFNFERSTGNTSWDGVGNITYGGPMIKGSYKRCASCATQSFDGYYPIDGSSLYMGNRSTASLYYYTPHTYPGYHGNYNFVNFYEDWFGPVHATYNFPDGMLIKGDKSPTVFLTKDGKRVSISMAEKFDSYNYSWSKVKTFPQSAVNNFPKGSSLPFAEGTIIKGTSATTYVVDHTPAGVRKSPFTKMSTFKSLGYTDGDIVRVANSELPPSSGSSISNASRHPDGSLVKFPGSSTVYYIEAGKKRPLTTSLHLSSNGWTTADISAGTTGDKNLPKGPVMTVREGTLVKSASSPTVYMVDSTEEGWARLRPFTRYENFAKFKLSVDNIKIVSDAYIRSTPRNPPIK